MSPWAEADPVPFGGFRPVRDLAGKKIGLFRNSKRAAGPILDVVERRLKERFPTAEFTEFANLRQNETITGRDDKGFEEWLERVDAVVTALVIEDRAPIPCVRLYSYRGQKEANSNVSE